MFKSLLLTILFLSPFLLLAQTPVDTTNVAIDTTGQKDLIDVAVSLFKLKKPRSKGTEKKVVYFSILPISSSVPGGSKALVTSTTAGFYLGERKTTYLSTINFAPYFNLKGRWGLPIHSSIWLENNTWNIQGDTRFLVYPDNTWGLGGGQPESAKFLFNYNYIRFYQSALKRVTPYFYAGIGYNLDYYADIKTNNDVPLSDYTLYTYGTAVNGGSFSSGGSINLLYDTRQNAFNPLPGAYGNLIYRHNAEFLGSDNNAQSLYIDLRKYISLTEVGPKNVIAFWSYYWTTISTGTPYLSLPSIGMDPYQRSGRGIQQNRYRGQSLIYFESEFRHDITANGLLGFVLFGNVNSASQGNTRQFVYFNPAGGGGLRIKYNKKSDTNICIDYGISKGYSSVTVALGEAF